MSLQEQLGEGLALEAEKALCALLCFSTDKFIRIKFIEGCLDNLANHRYCYWEEGRVPTMGVKKKYYVML